MKKLIIFLILTTLFIIHAAARKRQKTIPTSCRMKMRRMLMKMTKKPLGLTKMKTKIRKKATKITTLRKRKLSPKYLLLPKYAPVRLIATEIAPKREALFTVRMLSMPL